MPDSPFTLARVRGIRVGSVWKRRLAFAAGIVVAGLGLILLGESYLRQFPPRDFQPYLGDASPASGPFRADDRFIVQYRSWRDFEQHYPERVNHHQPVLSNAERRRVWAFFGNSFVQAPGMLGDTARDRLPLRTIFYLARNEPLCVRFAQVALLVENGLAPERVFIVLLPLDLYSFAQHSLDQIYVNDKGAITYRPRAPSGALGSLVRHSRLVLTAWVRGKMHHAEPFFRRSQLSYGVEASMIADLRRLFMGLGDATLARGIPVTVVLIPNYEQIARGAPCGLQDQLKPVLAELGFDVCDTRQAFLAVPNTARKDLFIPDKHFSAFGNRLLLDCILEHLRAMGADPETIDAGGAAR